MKRTSMNIEDTDQHLLSHAAKMFGLSWQQYMRMRAIEAARNDLAKQMPSVVPIQVSQEDWKQLEQLSDAPITPIPHLRKVSDSAKEIFINGN